MLQLQLYIEGEQIELYDDESITLTQSIQDVRDIKKIFYDYSRTFSVPASKNNNKIFKHFYNYFIDGFDARKKKDAELFLNYKPFKKGKIKLEGTTLKNNEAHTYKITFFGNTVSLPDALKDDKLSVLAELSSFDFSYTDANILEYMTDGLNAVIGDEEIEDAIIFPLITHTSRLTYDSGTSALNNIHPSTSGSNGVPLTQLKPALKIYAIIKAIELHYSINFSRDFFNPTNTVFTNLYMWLHTKAGSMFEDQGEAYQVTGWDILGDGKSVPGVTKKKASINIDNSRDGIKYEMSIVLFPANPNVTYNMVINRNGEEFQRFDGLIGTTRNGQENNTTLDTIDVKNGDFTIFIECSDATDFTCRFLIKRRGFGLNIGSFSANQRNTMLMQTVTSVLSNKPITVLSQLPDIKVIDFITGLFKTYNLTSFIDSEDVIQVKTLDNFYSSSTNNWNLTDHVVTDRSQIDSVIPYRQVDLAYKGLDTFLAENFKQINHKEWGTLEFERTSKFEGSKYLIELPFEHALYEKLINAANGDETKIQWGWIVDKSQEPTDTLPLLFYANRPASGQICVLKISGDRVLVNKPYMPMNSSGFFTPSNNTTQSLNFHAEIDEYQLKPNKNTLFKTYYEDYILDLFDVRKRITKLSAFLPSHIVQKLSLADIIIIFDKQYRINKITTDFKTGKSQLELTNILEKFVSRTLIVDEKIDIADDTISADNSILTADISGTSADGFDIPIETTKIPNVIPKNTAKSKFTNCEVTPASIEDVQNDIQNTSINFKYSIKIKGLKCGQSNIDEFGFLLSDTSSNLVASNDIDILKASSGVTAVPVVSNTSQPSLTIGTKNVDIRSLSASTTKFARFYVRTNTDSGFDKADVVSELLSGTTPGVAYSTSQTTFKARPAIVGVWSWDFIPTLAQIRENRGFSGFVDCGSVLSGGQAVHNGSAALPVVGDRVFVYHPQNLWPNGLVNYGGGINSAPADHQSKAYYIYGMGTQLIVTKFIVVETATATVKTIYNCP